MKATQIRINNKTYNIFCEPEEEEKLDNITKLINSKISQIKSSFKFVNHELTIILALVMLQDEIMELEKQKQLLLNKTAEANKEYIESKLAETLDLISEYVEGLTT